MFEIIEKLRQKPERSKKHVAFLVALFISGLIFVIWLSVIFPNWRESQMREARVEALDKTPGTAMSETFSRGFSAIGEQFKNIKEGLSSFSSEPEYYSATSSAQMQVQPEPEPKSFDIN